MMSTENNTDYTGTTGTVQFDQNEIVKLSLMFSQMYTEAFSPIREYISNGVRATRIAGTNKPVEVTIKRVNATDSVVTISDHGTGMSWEEMQETFLWIGRTTSVAGDGSAAGFGVGAKSGLSLSPHFLVSSVKNGKFTTINISAGNEGIEYQLMAQGATDKPNGTVVTLPISHSQTSDLVTSIKKNLVPFYSTDDVTFTLLGEVVAPDHSGIKRYGDVEFGYKSDRVNKYYGKNTIYAIVDGSPYKVPFDVDNLPELLTTTVIHCNEDEVTIPASREGLESSEKSITTINNKINDAVNIMTNNVIKRLETATESEFVDVVGEMSRVGNAHVITQNQKDYVELDFNNGDDGPWGLVIVSHSDSSEADDRAYQRMPSAFSVMWDRFEQFDKEESDSLKEKYTRLATHKFEVEESYEDFINSTVQLQIRVSYGRCLYGDNLTELENAVNNACERLSITNLQALEWGGYISQDIRVAAEDSVKVRREARKIAAKAAKKNSRKDSCIFLFKGKEYDIDELDDTSVFDGAAVLVVERKSYPIQSRGTQSIFDASLNGNVVIAQAYGTSTKDISKACGISDVKVYDRDFERMWSFSGEDFIGAPKYIVSRKVAEQCADFMKVLRESDCPKRMYLNVVKSIAGNVDKYTYDGEMSFDDTVMTYIQNCYETLIKWKCPVMKTGNYTYNAELDKLKKVYDLACEYSDKVAGFIED